MKRFEVIQGGKDNRADSSRQRGTVASEASTAVHPEIVIRYSMIRRGFAVLMVAATLAGLIYWSLSVFPNANIKPEIGYFGLAVLGGSLLVSLISVLNRLGTVVVLAPESVRAEILGVFGNRRFEIRYSEIASVGYAGQGEAPAVLITEDSKKKTKLPGLLFKDRPVLVEVLQDRVIGARRALADQIEFPRSFSRLWQGWISVLAMFVTGLGILSFNFLTERRSYLELGLAGAMLSMTVALAFLGVAPFVTYVCGGRVIRRKPWFRPDLSKSVDLRDAKRFSISLGPQRRLHLFDEGGSLLMTFELSAFDFSGLVFWAERALERIER